MAVNRVNLPNLGAIVGIANSATVLAGRQPRIAPARPPAGANARPPGRARCSAWSVTGQKPNCDIDLGHRTLQLNQTK
jgi:hypothetical protein